MCRENSCLIVSPEMTKADRSGLYYMRSVKCSPPARGVHWLALPCEKSRCSLRFVMTVLSCRRCVDNAPRHCRFLRTFDFAGDCRVNFLGVCCIVAREYVGRRFAATRGGVPRLYVPFRPSPLPRRSSSFLTQAPGATRVV